MCVMHCWQCTGVVVMNRDEEIVSFSLKFKGAETLTPKVCCHGSEAVPSSAGVGFWFSLDETRVQPIYLCL